MARTKLTPVALKRNEGVSTETSFTTIDSTLVTAGTYIDALPYKTDKLIIYVKNTAASDLAVTVAKGASVFAESVKGDLDVTVVKTSGEQMIQIDSSRFLQAGSTINIDFATGFTGSIAVIYTAD